MTREQFEDVMIETGFDFDPLNWDWADMNYDKGNAVVNIVDLGGDCFGIIVNIYPNDGEEREETFVSFDKAAEYIKSQL